MIVMNYRIILKGQIQDRYYDDVDVYVLFPDRQESYVATFYTPAAVAGYWEYNRVQGDTQGGAYFLATSWLMVRELTHESIRQTVADLLASGQFVTVFEVMSHYFGVSITLPFEDITHASE
jgi:hypothetical protein